MKIKNNTIGKYKNDQINEKITDKKGNLIRNYAIIAITDDQKTATITQNGNITTIPTDDKVIQEIIKESQKKTKPKTTKKDKTPKKTTPKNTKE